jgi:hypothetical protein
MKKTLPSRAQNTKTVLVALKAQKKDFTVIRVEKAVNVS